MLTILIQLPRTQKETLVFFWHLSDLITYDLPTPPPLPAISVRTIHSASPHQAPTRLGAFAPALPLARTLFSRQSGVHYLRSFLCYLQSEPCVAALYKSEH